MSEQQLTESDVPLLVDRCIDYITQCGTGQVLGCWWGPERGIWVTPLVWCGRLRTRCACDTYFPPSLNICSSSVGGLHLQQGFGSSEWNTCGMGSSVAPGSV